MLKIITEIDRKDWDELLEKSHYASVFQSFDFYKFIKSLDFFGSFSFGVVEDEQLKGVITGYIAKEKGIKSFFSRRAIVHGGVLLDERISHEALDLLLKSAKKDLSSRAIYLEIRNYKDYSVYKDVFLKNKFTYEPHYNFHVQTRDVDSAFKQLNSTKRRYVRKSFKNNVEIVCEPNVDDIQGFYQVLLDLYSKKLKLPLLPFEFFEKLSKTDFTKFFLLKYSDKIVGGSLCLSLGNEILYELFVCGQDGEVKNVYPSILATWIPIEYAAKNGYEYFDMMGGGKPNESYGVREFKAQFGGELVEHGRFLYVCNTFLYKFGKLGLKILKKL